MSALRIGAWAAVFFFAAAMALVPLYAILGALQASVAP